MRAKFSERLRYRIDNVFAGGPRGQLFLLGILSLGVIAVGMLAYFVGLFETEEVEGVRRGIDAGFWDTLWWSAKHIVDPATFDMDYGSRWPVIVISVLVSLMGMIIFASFIGLISAAVEEKVGALNKGRSPVIETGHVLILGWSNRAFPVIDMLNELNVRRKIVALADKDVEAMREDLRVNCSSKRKSKVILRTGSPTSMVELERVAFDRAFSIIVLADESAAARGEESDISVIKTLMLLSNPELWVDGAQRPKMVAEITKSENVEIAEIAGQRHIPVICSSQIIGKVLVQTARQPGLAAVYGQIFFGGGSQIYVQGFPETAGKQFSEIMHCFPGAIPLGVSSARKDPVDGFITYVPALNPRPDRVIKQDEWIILLTERLHNQFTAAPPVVDVPPLPAAQHQTRDRHVIERIVILGWNRGLYGMLREIDEYALPGATVRVVAGHDDETASALIAKELHRPLRNVQFQYRKGDYLRRPVLEAAVTGNPSCICILRDESSGESDLDARLIMASVLLRDQQQQLGVDQPKSHVVAEVSSPQNRELLERTSAIDVVAGPEVASWLLTQISQQQMLLRVYDDLLNAGGNEIYLKPAGRYVTAGASAHFAQVREQAQRLGEIAIGVMRANRAGFESLINPPPDQSFAFGERDKVIVIAEDLFLESTRQQSSSDTRTAGRPNSEGAGSRSD
ncbi:MAG: hypothetical protein H7Z14_20580, partial [Anaerolineae bacterium]|nr:hypothetical protein [Phycisphaerae bacterium]